MRKDSPTRISRFLSLVLRHNPGRIGVRLDAAGWIEVAALLDACERHGVVISRDLLERVVRENDKQRFAFSEDGLRIRASQGHSIAVNLGYEPVDPPEVLYHGTASRFVGAILTQGIRKRSRQHVHLSPDEETAKRVGGRHGSPVVLRIRAGAMRRDGHLFYLSQNGVWLTDSVPPRYIDAEE